MSFAESLEQLAAARAPELGAELIASIAEAFRERGGDPRVCGEVYELERAKDRDSRRAGGVYYTPPHIVELVVERALGPRLGELPGEAALAVRVVDPACGGAVFLLAALDHIAQHLGCSGIEVDDSMRAEIARRCLCGADVDPRAAAVSRLALSLACGGADLSACVRVGDSLLDESLLEREAWDAVVGNPPWGQKGFRFDDGVKKRLRQRYRTARGVLDPFKLFVELAHELTLAHGRWALVLPDIILLKNQQAVRDLILEGSSIEWIVDLGRAFADVNLDSVLIAARRGAAAPEHRVQVWHQLPPSWRDDPPPVHTIEQRVFSELSAHRFNIHLDESSLARLRALAELPRFGERFEPHEGVHSGNVRAKLFRDRRPRGPCAGLVVGRKELERYRLQWAGAWIDLDPAVVDRAAGEYANLGRPQWHQRPKIVVRRTGDRIIAAFDAEGYYVSNNLFVVIPRGEMDAEELLATTALLNSGFMTWYFRTVQPRTGRLFAELKIEHLVDFPLPTAAAWAPAVSPLAALARKLAQGPDEAASAEVDRIVERLYAN